MPSKSQIEENIVDRILSYDYTTKEEDKWNELYESIDKQLSKRKKADLNIENTEIWTVDLSDDPSESAKRRIELIKLLKSHGYKMFTEKQLLYYVRSNTATTSGEDIRYFLDHMDMPTNPEFLDRLKVNDEDLIDEVAQNIEPTYRMFLNAIKIGNFLKFKTMYKYNPIYFDDGIFTEIICSTRSDTAEIMTQFLIFTLDHGLKPCRTHARPSWFSKLPFEMYFELMKYKCFRDNEEIRKHIPKKTLNLIESGKNMHDAAIVLMDMGLDAWMTEEILSHTYDMSAYDVERTRQLFMQMAQNIAHIKYPHAYMEDAMSDEE